MPSKFYLHLYYVVQRTQSSHKYLLRCFQKASSLAKVSLRSLSKQSSMTDLKSSFKRKMSIMSPWYGVKTSSGRIVEGWPDFRGRQWCSGSSSSDVPLSPTPVCCSSVDVSPFRIHGIPWLVSVMLFRGVYTSTRNQSTSVEMSPISLNSPVMNSGYLHYHGSMFKLSSTHNTLSVLWWTVSRKPT